MSRISERSSTSVNPLAESVPESDEISKRLLRLTQPRDEARKGVNKEKEIKIQICRREVESFRDWPLR